MIPARTPDGLVIVDSGLRSYGGHNYFYTLEVQRALKRLGFSVRVLVNRGFPSEAADAVGFTPAFSAGAHDHALGQGFLRDLAYVHAQSVVFTHELDAALEENSQDLVFSHTLADFELIGWNRYIKRREFLGRLALLMRVVPGTHGASRFRQAFHPYLIKPRCLRALGTRLGGRFTLATDSRPLSLAYSSVFPGRIVTLPIPVSKELSDSSGASKALDGGLHIGYLGDARESKGFYLLPGAIRDLLPKTEATTRFVIQMSWPSQGRGAGDVPAGVAELEDLAAAHPDRIRLIRQKLDPDEYRLALIGLDIVLLPYSTGLYREATSGIFAEALHLAKVVVVSEDTWMAHELRRSGGGTIHHRNDAADLTVQILRAIDDYEGFRKRASAFQDEWNAFHNPDELARALIRVTGDGSVGFADCGSAARINE